MKPALRLAALAALLLSGCGAGDSRRAPPTELPVNVFADTGRAERFPIPPPARAGGGRGSAVVWLTQVAPARPQAMDVELPDAAPAVPEDLASPSGLEVDQGLKPPLLRLPGSLRVPRDTQGASVELDVRVAEDGSVSDALWAGGSTDSALVEAAVSCALGMRFYPALRAGRPVAVWCRQCFEFGRR